MTEIEITSQTGVKVYISKWDDGGLWIRLGLPNGSIHTSLNLEQAKQMFNCFQSILFKEVEQ